MKKYFMLAAILGAFMAPLIPSAAMAEESGFFKKKYEQFQDWRNSSNEEKQTMKKQRKAQEKRKAAHDKQNAKVKKRRTKANNKRRAAQQKRKPNQWENMNE